MLHPSVVENVSATRSGAVPSSAASCVRTCSRSAITLVNQSLPPRPSSWSWRIRSSIAASVARDSGPIVPAFMYAQRSKTGNCARASS
jgi:hypothetical protein